MNESLLHVIAGFAGKRILVIGEAMLDAYLEGFSERLCREAPVPVVTVTDYKSVPGGAANAAVNVRSLGAEAIFLSVIGEDADGAVLRRSLEEQGVETQFVLASARRRTLAKQRLIAGSQMVVRFDQGSTAPLDRAAESALIEQIARHFPRCDAVLISDYNYGILTPAVIRALAELQAADPHMVAVDSKRLAAFRPVNVAVVKPNYEEAAQLLGLRKVSTTASRVEQIAQRGARLLELTGAEVAAITLDEDGALIFTRGEPTPYRTYAAPQPPSRSAGAGDTYVSALTLSLAAGAQLENAAELASAAAAIVVGKPGTSSCHAEELYGYFTRTEKFVTDVFQLVAGLAAYRREARRIVFTNGCFDILHRGHIAYLNRAKALGDVLIVGVNSDPSVRRLKGARRPINSLEDRVQILAALSCVDHIVPFDADTPHELIRVIRPDVFVKGGDYRREAIPEASLVEELGGTVEVLPYLEDHSTTHLIEKIRNIYAQSAS